MKRFIIAKIVLSFLFLGTFSYSQTYYNRTTSISGNVCWCAQSGNGYSYIWVQAHYGANRKGTPQAYAGNDSWRPLAFTQIQACEQYLSQNIKAIGCMKKSDLQGF